MARPTIPEAQRRVVNFTIRLTEDELDLLTRYASLCGITPSEVIREKVFNGRFPKPKASRIERDLFLELKRIGNNLNRQTRLLHTGRLAPDFAATLSKLKANEDTIIKLLTNDSHSKDR